MTAETEDPTDLRDCPHCGKSGLKGVKGIDFHYRAWCPENPNSTNFEKLRDERLRATWDRKETGTVNIQSQRGMSRRGFSTRAATPMEQVRGRPGGLTGGPAAYFLNPKGATIAEILIIYPNGAPVHRNGKEIGNAMYAQNRQAEKGYEYVGPTLTVDSAKRLVEILESNRTDFVLDLTEQIADCEHDIAENDRPEVRDNQRKRRVQLDRLLEQARTPLDGQALVKNLNDIVQAHKLAAIPPAMRDAIASIAGDVASDRVLSMVGQLSGGKTVAGDGLTVQVTNAAEGDDF
jgi:hypothetical protein|tara:strand:- start:3216 stop:4088 length:873 start_codon:yes stop_codon:yes gene_type:complete